jgi:hypothetical protein
MQYAGQSFISDTHKNSTVDINCIIGFFVVPLLGVFIDMLGNRISISKSVEYEKGKEDGNADLF